MDPNALPQAWVDAYNKVKSAGKIPADVPVSTQTNGGNPTYGNLDPNGPGLLNWPQYTTSSPKLMTFLDGPVPLNITEDTFRVEGMDLLTKLLLANPL